MDEDFVLLLCDVEERVVEERVVEERVVEERVVEERVLDVFTKRFCAAASWFCNER